MSAAKFTPGPWQIRKALTLERGTYYTVSRVVNRHRVHMSYASDGRPMLYSLESAERAVAALSKATGSAEGTTGGEGE